MSRKPDIGSIPFDHSRANESGPALAAQSAQYTSKPSDKPKDLKEIVEDGSLELVQLSNPVSKPSSRAPSTHMDLDNDSCEDGEIIEDVEMEMDVDSDDESIHITTTPGQSTLDSTLSTNSVVSGDRVSDIKRPAIHNGNRPPPFSNSSTAAVKPNDQVETDKSA